MFITIRARNVHGGFSEKILVLVIWALLGPKWPKIWLFAKLLKNGSNDFLDFLHEVTTK
jgi:hypothetical protein